MRDINRIFPFCGKLANAWMNFPDWRFGQFIVNFLKWYGADPFYLEDDETERLLENYVMELSNSQDESSRNNGLRRLHIMEETFQLNSKTEWNLKDILYVPVLGKDVAFRVEHISDEKVYFVAVDSVGKSTLDGVDEFLDYFLKKMPDSLVDIMCEMEHRIDGRIVRKSKLTLLSKNNLVDEIGDYECDGEDDILFDGLKTEADRCKNLGGLTTEYWTDTLSVAPEFHYFVHNNGIISSTGRDIVFSVIPCFSIYK